MTDEDVTPRHAKKYSIPSKRTQDDSEQILKEAAFAHKEGRLAEAEKGYLEVLRRKPDWGQVLNALGTAFLDQSRPDKAKKVFGKAADLRPPYLPSCYNLARLKQRENDHKAAISIYRAMSEVDFSQIYEEFQPKILHYVSRLTGQQEAEGIAQEVFEKASRGLKSLKGESKIEIFRRQL